MQDQIDDTPADGPLPAQTPPADELYAVREQLKRLEERERELKLLMLSDASARTGNQYVAEIKSVVTQRTDWKEIKALHPQLVAEYTWPVTTQRVELRGISEDGEIFRLRRARA